MPGVAKSAALGLCATVWLVIAVVGSVGCGDDTGDDSAGDTADTADASESGGLGETDTGVADGTGETEGDTASGGATAGEELAASVSARSSSIVVDGASVAVASPDDNQVVWVNAQTLAVERAATVFGAPGQLALLDNGTLFVSHEADSRIAVIEPGQSPLALPTPCGGMAGIVAYEFETSEHLWVACPFDGLVLHFVDRALAGQFEPGGRPTGLAAIGDRVWVSLASGAVGAGQLVGYRWLGCQPSTCAEPLVIAPAGDEGRGVSQMRAVTVGPRRTPWALYQSVDHDGDRDRPADEGGYGKLPGGRPRIEPRILGTGVGTRYARFDLGPRVFSGPSALAWSDKANLLWVANEYTDNVAVIDTTGATVAGQAVTDEAEVVAHWTTGRGPRGITLSADGRTAWVDVGFNYAVARLDLPTTPERLVPTPSTLERSRPMTSGLYSQAALDGRKLFHDATNIQLTPSGVVTCATCHPGGGEDGLSWFLHTVEVPRKYRRTPAAWNAKARLAPYHWDGEFTDAATLSRETIENLMNGAGLLVETEKIAAYLNELAFPIAAANLDAESVARGAGLFSDVKAQCASCHTGPDSTDRQPHSVVAASKDPDGVLAQVITPTLRAVRTRPPYLHDGRAPSLAAVLVEHNAGDTHGRTSQLTSAELDDLIAYLKSL